MNCLKFMIKKMTKSSELTQHLMFGRVCFVLHYCIHSIYIYNVKTYDQQCSYFIGATSSSEASPTIWSWYPNLNHYHYSFL